MPQCFVHLAWPARCSRRTRLTTRPIVATVTTELDLEGEYWKLRPASTGDVDSIQRHGDHPDSSWLGVPSPCPRGRAEEVVRELGRGWSGSFGLGRLVVAKADGAIIGLVSMQRRASSCIEICYGVAPAWRGRGLATELLLGLTTYVIEVAQWTTRVELVIDPSNAASQRVAVKAGYRPDGRRQGVVEGTGDRFDDLVFVNARSGCKGPRD